MSKSSPFVLVTGATGLLGNNVVRLLLKQGKPVRVLVRENSDREPLRELDVEVSHADIRDSAAVATACRGASVIIHAAALVRIGGRGMDTFRAVNTEGTRNVVRAAQKESARLIYVSTSDTISCGTPGQLSDEGAAFDEKHATCYSMSKYEGEQIVRDACTTGLHGVIVNPSFMLGPWDWKPSSGAMLAAVGCGRGAIAPSGYVCIADVRDVAAATISAAFSGTVGERYLLTGETLSYRKAWSLFAEVTGSRRPLCQLGPTPTKIVGAGGDLWGFLTGKEPIVNSTALRAASCPRLYCSQKAKRDLGYQTRPLRETVEGAWKWFNPPERGTWVLGS